MKKNREYRIQHYIPQCYLRNFSPNNKNIFIYDKILHKSYSNSIDKIAYKDYFYDLPEKYLRDIDKIPSGTKFYEKEFFAENVESIFANLLDKIVHKANLRITQCGNEEILTIADKAIFAQLIAIQFLRMPSIREKYSEARKKMIEQDHSIIKEFIKRERPELKDALENIRLKYDSDYDSIFHSEIYANEEFYYGMAEQIVNKHWIFYYTSDNDFFTSDNPILVKPHIPNQQPFYEGFGMRGVEIIFPISSSIMLTLLDEQYFQNIEFSTNTFNRISDKQKREYNCHQYFCATRQVYSVNNDFNLIKKLIEINNGNEFFKPKSRVLVNGK